MDVMDVALITLALATSDGFAISDYFDHESDAIATTGRPLPIIQISPAGGARMSIQSFFAGLRTTLRIAVLEAVFFNK
jgi:4-hydroxybenzoate polyprenyltransferase